MLDFNNQYVQMGRQIGEVENLDIYMDAGKAMSNVSAAAAKAQVQGLASYVKGYEAAQLDSEYMEKIGKANGRIQSMDPDFIGKLIGSAADEFYRRQM